MPEEMPGENAGRPEDHTSESEEMYLLTIAVAEEDGLAGPLPVADLASRLAVSPASANEMIRKLERRSFVGYEPYRGVELTASGRRVAHRVLRVRRLWSSFLASGLGMAPDESDALACKLEHVTPPVIADRLAGYLDDPQRGPLGRPIPGGSAAPAAPVLDAATAPVGVDLHVIGLAPEAAAFFAARGLGSGDVVRVGARDAAGLLLLTDSGPIEVAAGIAGGVEVRVVE